MGSKIFSFGLPLVLVTAYRLIPDHVRGLTGSTPLWVNLPLLPPAWREAWAELKADPAKCKVVLKAHESQHKAMRWVVPLGVLAFLFIAVVGNLAKYVIAHGGHVPGMTS